MMQSQLEIAAVPAFSDNYIWLVHDGASGETVVVDPGDGSAALDAAQRRGWTITQIWNTHWHADHVGGNLQVKEATGCVISGPAAESIAGMDVRLGEGDSVRLGEHTAAVWHVPGHTLGHIAFILEAERVAFVGDTLFAMGCGRLFEGTPGQMFRSLQRIAALPEDTRLYCAHEYTLSNARFAVHADPNNREISDRLARVGLARAEARITVPTSVSEERATNPFVRAGDEEEFTALRRRKDSFR
jgi:hydroxyacylglutathione hydrolase